MKLPTAHVTCSTLCVCCVPLLSSILTDAGVGYEVAVDLHVQYNFRPFFDL